MFDSITSMTSAEILMQPASSRDIMYNTYFLQVSLALPPALSGITDWQRTVCWV